MSNVRKLLNMETDAQKQQRKAQLIEENVKKRQEMREKYNIGSKTPSRIIKHPEPVVGCINRLRKLFCCFNTESSKSSQPKIRTAKAYRKI